MVKDRTLFLHKRNYGYVTVRSTFFRESSYYGMSPTIIHAVPQVILSHFTIEKEYLFAAEAIREVEKNADRQIGPDQDLCRWFPDERVHS